MVQLMTFVGKSLAKVGFRFYFKGINQNCPKNCSLYTTCQTNLKPNKVYEVIEVLKRELECPKDLHEEPMRLVRVNEPEIEVALHNKDVYEGSIVNYIPVHCDHEECEYFEFCEPNSLMIKEEDRVKIVKVIKKIKDCKNDYHLTIVKIEKK
ncbi:MAG: UPF0179 family protein [Promethearchaeota archaeon]